MLKAQPVALLVMKNNNTLGGPPSCPQSQTNPNSEREHSGVGAEDVSKNRMSQIGAGVKNPLAGSFKQYLMSHLVEPTNIPAARACRSQRRFTKGNGLYHRFAACKC